MVASIRCGIGLLSAMERFFLGWDGPCLARAVDWLVERFGTAGALDLGRAVVAVPGSRAGRRLLEILVDRAERDRLAWTPPRIMTVGRLAEELYETRRPFAGALVQQLAWIEALKARRNGELKRLISFVPPDDDLAGWLSLAEMLGRLHRELAAEGLDFGRVADLGSKIKRFREQGRWKTLAEVQQRYLRILDGLELWDLQTARLFAIEHRLCRTDAEVVLVGTVDLNQQQRLILDQVADRVTALVFAPPSLAARFDGYGCLNAEAWQDAAIELDDGRIEVVEGPGDQATAVLRAIAEFGGRYSAEEIVVGVPDNSLTPYLEQQFEACQLRTRSGVGFPIARSAPYRLLSVLAEYLSVGRYSSFASLVRQPAVHDWLAAQGIEGDWLTQMDGYCSEHFPPSLDGHWLGPADCCNRVKQVHEAILGLVAPLRTGEPATVVEGQPDLTRSVRSTLGGAAAATSAVPGGSDKRPLCEWGQPIMDLLVDLFGRDPLDQNVPAERAVLIACEKIHEAALEYQGIDARLAPKVSGAEAIRLILREGAGEAIPSLADREAIELLGWLELPLDDAPALIVTSVNEGLVPASLNSDLFLPNQLRRALGIEDNDHRYARDAYALSLLAASRTYLKLVAGRRSSQGDPLAPSRLLFACDPRRVARRVRRFLDDRPSRLRAVLPGTLRPGRTRSPFEPPRPLPLVQPITSMSVTEFRDYLACPYRYYLRRCLGLAALGDVAEELDGAAFGSLTHAVLKRFGDSELAASTSPDDIYALLDDALNRAVLRKYGRLPLSAVRVQVEQLRLRLRAFARWQAAWVGQGWRIEYVEKEINDGQAAFSVDGTPMVLRGRVDRIDVHESTGQRILFDYKTSDTPKTPDQIHRRRREWVDLQLPLYKHLAGGLGLDGSIRLGYIALPKDTSRVGELLAEWTDDDFVSADDAAEEVIRQVRAERFWPPATTPPEFCEDLAAICMDNQFGAPSCDDGEGDGEP